MNWGLIKPVNGWPVVPVGLGTFNIIWLPAFGFILYKQKWSNIEPLGTGGATFKAKLPSVVVVFSYIVCTLLGSYSNLIKSPGCGVKGKVILLKLNAMEAAGVTWVYWLWFSPVNPNDVGLPIDTIVFLFVSSILLFCCFLLISFDWRLSLLLNCHSFLALFSLLLILLL